MSERRIMERFDEIMAGFDKHPYARLMERNTALEMLVIKQRDLLDECERQMKVLIANAEGCLMNHYPDDYALQGTPGWLLDCKATLARLRGEPPAQEKADV